MSSTGELLIKLRNEIGLSSTELADIIGVSKSSISKWENDADEPSIDALLKLSRFFRVTVDELLQGELGFDNDLKRLLSKYDLSQFDVPTLIKNKDVKELVLYYKTAQRIKDAYYDLIIKASTDELDSTEKEIYKIAQKYFYLDLRYSRDMKSLYETGIDKSEIEAFSQFLSKLSHLSKEEREWEISKIIKPTNTFNLYGGKIGVNGLEDAYSEMVKLLTQYEKDMLLNNIRIRPIDMFRNPHVLALLESGAHILKLGVVRSSYWCDEQVIPVLDLLKPIEVPKEESYLNQPFYQHGGYCSYSEYLESVDFEKTEKYLEIMRLRKTNPYSYYSKLKAGLYDQILDLQ